MTSNVQTITPKPLTNEAFSRFGDVIEANDKAKKVEEAAAKAKKGELVYLLDKSPQRSKSQKKKPPSKYHKTTKKGKQFNKKS